MKEKWKIYAHLFEQLEQLRKEANITVTQLCKDSNVSTRTYAKIKKRQPVKDECYWRLFIGICKGATPEEIVEFWERFGEWFVGVYGEE